MNVYSVKLTNIKNSNMPDKNRMKLFDMKWENVYVLIS